MARKLICLVYHLLINQELYQEEDCERRKSKPAKSDPTSSYSPEEQLEDKVAAIVDSILSLKGAWSEEIIRWGWIVSLLSLIAKGFSWENKEGAKDRGSIR